MKLIDAFRNFAKSALKQVIEQVNSFNYLGNILSYEKELDIDNKLHNYLKITGIINNVLRPQKSLKKTTIKLYNTLALPVLLYGSETGTNKARDARRITAAEMKYMRRTAGYTWIDQKNKYTKCKGLKNNTNSGQIIGIQEKLDTT
jgi:hypothetical protein